MKTIYPPEIQVLDRIYQEESTVQNELALEKAKLSYYREQQKANPGDKDLQERIRFHETEVARLEMEIKMV